MIELERAGMAQTKGLRETLILPHKPEIEAPRLSGFFSSRRLGLICDFVQYKQD